MTQTAPPSRSADNGSQGLATDFLRLPQYRRAMLTYLRYFTRSYHQRLPTLLLSFRQVHPQGKLQWHRIVFIDCQCWWPSFPYPNLEFKKDRRSFSYKIARSTPAEEEDVHFLTSTVIEVFVMEDVVVREYHQPRLPKPSLGQTPSCLGYAIAGLINNLVFELPGMQQWRFASSVEGKWAGEGLDLLNSRSFYVRVNEACQSKVFLNHADEHRYIMMESLSISRKHRSLSCGRPIGR
ncbi:hypothetical protein F4604DRAFT_918616 [Suillus subluteus]|nr:hypothetical protein F4604DRAFT_918616 [Suillus subluteus]